MGGRQEHREQIEHKINIGLEDYPKLLRDYSYSFTDKTVTTKRAYINYLKEYIRYLIKNGENPNDINYYKTVKTSDINRYMEHIHYRDTSNGRKENKESIRAVKLAALTDFYEFLISEEYIDKNPCQRIKPPRKKEERNVISLTEEEISNIKNSILYGEQNARKTKFEFAWRYRDYTIFTLGCRTGLRATAISEINIDDINFDDKYIIVTEKGNVTRPVFISDDTIAILKRWLSLRDQVMFNYPKENSLFISNRRTRITQAAIALLISKHTKDLEKHITPHKMRSTCAVNLYEKSGDIYLVQEILGHSNINNTRRYVAISNERKKSAAELLNSL